MALGRPNLGSILIRNGIVSQHQLDAAVRYQAEDGCRLGEALVTLGACTEVQIAQALAEQLELPFVDLHLSPPVASYAALIPREAALEYGVLPIRMEGNRLLVVARDPFDIRVDEMVRQATDMPVILGIAPESQLRELLHQFYKADSMPTWSPEDVEENGANDHHEISLEKLVAAADKVSTVRVVNSLIADAVRRGASDLHIEPEENCVRVRYRIDGRMCPIASLHKSLVQSITARVKILCSMDISENRKPQDGGCRLKIHGRNIELRGSTLPGIHGEIVVLRILSQDAGLQRLDALGYDDTMLRSVRSLLAAKQGMLLITGPTGSGKTTSLYGALGHLNKDDVNIITVEDPVEMKIPGINQVEVHDRAGRSFASTLRSMLRQDPDIIMVGEIRDLETADIACRAALTGHLVLSTLHTLDSVSTMARLQDMGVAPFMLAAALTGVVAQRLARKICDHCVTDYTLPPGLRRAFEGQYGSLHGARFRRGSGCNHCQQRGTRGRVGIFELLMIDEEVRHLMTEGAPPKVLRDHLLKGGFRTLEEDAFRKAYAGIIPPEEVLNLGLGLAMAVEGASDEPDAEIEVEPFVEPEIPDEDPVAAAALDLITAQSNGSYAAARYAEGPRWT